MDNRTSRRSSRRTFVFGTGLAVAAGAAGIGWYRRVRGRRGNGKFLAVLHFDDSGTGPAHDWTNYVLLDLLTANLSRLTWLHPLSAYAVRDYLSRPPSALVTSDTPNWRRLAAEMRLDYYVTGELSSTADLTELRLVLGDTDSDNSAPFVLHSRRPDALPDLADQAAAAIASHLASELEAPHFESSASLSGSRVALEAYAAAQAPARNGDVAVAIAACRKALAADPDFLMCRILLAGLLQQSDPVEALALSQRAEELAARPPVPPYHRAFARITRLYLQRDLPQCVEALQSAIAAHPQELTLLTDLAGVRLAEWNLESARDLLERVHDRDFRNELADSLSTSVLAFLGEVPRALAAADRFSQLRPKDDPDPVSCRGNAYSIDGRLGEAISAYRKAGNSPALAISAIHAAQFDLASSALKESQPSSPAFAADGSASLSLALGNVELAVEEYETASRLEANPIWSWYHLWKAGGLLLEQNRPADVLALGHRSKSQFAPGLSAVAQLIMGNSAEANQLLATATRTAKTLFGETMAAGLETHHRLLAAFFRSEFKSVLDLSERSLPCWRALISLYVARARLELADPRSADRELRFTARAMLGFGVNAELAAQHNYVAWLLTHFYLGRVLEKIGREEDAAAQYSAYLQHCGRGRAALPQSPAAQAALTRLLAPKPRQTDEPRK